MTTLHALPPKIGYSSIYGTSGCTIRVDAAETVKIAGRMQHTKRLSAQGRFMHKVTTGIFPRVIELMHRSYTMETLFQVDWTRTDPVLVMEKLNENLRNKLWELDEFYEAPTKNWVDSLDKYLAKKLEELSLPLELIAKIHDRVMELKTLKLSPAVIHGDPTLDNCMLRPTEKGYDLVVIDPLPAGEGKMPNIRAVDLGKMLQSAIGYEHVIYGDERFPHDSRLGKAKSLEMSMRILSGQDDDDTRGAWIFCMIHLVRLLPYQSRHKRVFTDLLEQVVKYVER